MNNVYATPNASLELESDNTSGQGKEAIIPKGVKGWSWGAFLLNWIWAIGNKSWIGLFALIPFVGFFVALIMGFQGREWAWKNKRWDSLEHFNKVQRKWSKWAFIILLLPFVIGILASVFLPEIPTDRH